MNLSTIKTPGVYINESNSFTNSVMPVATAVPAFIGYTPQAVYQGKNYTNVPFRISCLSDFEAIFCIPAASQYAPQYYLSPVKDIPTTGDYIQINDTIYSIMPDAATVYYLYNSIRLFYLNGGGDAYIVSVGGYGPASGKPAVAGQQVINSNVQLNALLGGLAALQQEEEPTMYICPDATLLSVVDNGTLMTTMLTQCSGMQTAISIFDIIGGNTPDPVLYMADITTFRASTGLQGLNYGAAYYPFVGTTVVQQSELNYTNLFGGDVKQLALLLPEPGVAAVILAIENSASALTPAQLNNALLAASQTYALIMQHVLAAANLLPPSAGIAGLITTTDNEIGVWAAPANVGMVGVVSLPIKLTEAQQQPLNVDSEGGKSINAIRSFTGIGILVWGARTLDGNSQDWRYLAVRRTMTFIEQSCKLAARAYVFAPNNKNTWEAAKAMVGSFLNGLWKQGGLMGASSADAFSVACGLGSTMTDDDILQGRMIMTILVAVIHPAEFMVITFEQQMATS